MGLLISLVGLSASNLVVPNEHTIIGLGDLTANESMLTLLGLLLVGTMMHFKINGAILISIMVITVIDWTFVSAFPKQFINIPSFRGYQTDKYISFQSLESSSIVPIITLVAVTLFDVGGVVYGMSFLVGLNNKTIENRNEQLELETHPTNRPVNSGTAAAFVGCAVATICGACLGTSVNIVYVESASGIREGGKTGLTAVTTSIMFFLSVFIAPMAGQIPSSASCPVLIVIGAMMMSQTRYIEWGNVSQGIPAFLTIIFMPFTFSINNGIFIGILFSFLFYITTGEIFLQIRDLWCVAVRWFITSNECDGIILVSLEEDQENTPLLLRTTTEYPRSLV